MNKFNRKQWAVFYTLVATSILLVSGLIFAISKKGIESAEAAAWLQAAASVGTIIAAVWVMNAQHVRAESEQRKQAITERANVIASVGFFSVEVQGLLRAAKDAIKDGRVSREKAHIILARLHSALAAVSEIPSWKSPLDETAEIRIIVATCRNVVAGIEAADAADRILQESVGRQGLLPTFAVPELSPLLVKCAASIAVSQQFLDDRYLELTGQTLRI